VRYQDELRSRRRRDQVSQKATDARVYVTPCLACVECEVWVSPACSKPAVKPPLEVSLELAFSRTVVPLPQSWISDNLDTNPRRDQLSRLACPEQIA